MNAKADAADQKALAAGQAADEANQNATKAGTRVTSLAGTVENLDNYKPVNETTVLFGFDKAQLTRKDKQTLDDFAQQMQDQKHSIVQVEGYTDSTGPADYNYQLSQQPRRRGHSVPGAEVQRACVQDFPDWTWAKTIPLPRIQPQLVVPRTAALMSV